METRAALDSLADTLDSAHKLLLGKANYYSALNPAARALRRLRQAISRPFRLAVLGESNSGKSTIANLITGEMALPALPIANTRLPTLLHYSAVPFVAAIHESGQRFALGPRNEISLDGIARLEVGLPSETLRAVEVLDFPGSANPLFQTDILAVLRHGVDGAIWATVATQAWRETERVAWLRLPARIRLHGLLAVTHFDLITRKEDCGKLITRLQTVAQPCFQAMCLVPNPPQATAAAKTSSPASADDLLANVRLLLTNYQTGLFEKAVTVTRRVAATALARLEQD